MSPDGRAIADLLVELETLLGEVRTSLAGLEEGVTEYAAEAIATARGLAAEGLTAIERFRVLGATA